ncbi:MAG: hypothetical protein K0S57_95 [Ramlibacter sp.]|jgi:hypothetical protein|nr:hypothetical protein [Ramlibacter sp.]
MSTHGPEGRSYLPIEREDLERLLRIAMTDLEEFFCRHADWASLYRDRVLGFALCQGAANHFIGRGDGVQDFDVYAFLAQHPDRSWGAYRRRSERDFEDPKFGRSPDTPQFIGRRVDVLTRGLRCAPGSDFATALREYLQSSRTETARELARKAAILLTPSSRMGEVVWPPA